MKIDSPLSSAIKTTAKHIQFLETQGIETIEDFLMNVPREYEDRTKITEISNIRADEKNVLIGIFSNVVKEKTKNKGMAIVKANFVEEKSGEFIECIWFNMPHLEKTLPLMQKVMVVGKAKMAFGKISLPSPSVEKYDGNISEGNIFPLYSDKGFIPAHWFYRKIHEEILPLLEKNKIEIPDIMPEDIQKKEGLLSRKEAFIQLHSPTSQKEIEHAKKTFAFEELFILQLAALQNKNEFQKQYESNISGISLNPELIKDFFETLPFTPTNAQKIALFEILKDYEKSVPMQRMLEGDVGSGKTLVALMACISIMQAKKQCVILAPTEILASQHFMGIQKFITKAEEFGFFEKWFLEKDVFSTKTPRIDFLSGSVIGKKRKTLLEDLRYGKIDLLIGTHAVIEDPVIFSELGLVVIDEQHRFGVLQREKLLQKGTPHFLQMTATPIPRSLAIVAFGDQDLSVLNELPPGRKPIETKVVHPAERRTIELFIDDQLTKGRQAFIICPLVEDSENFENLKSATEEFLRLEEHIFPHRKIALLHGRMSANEKDEIMKEFKNHKYDILVSTSVVEVGVDVPNASIMLIEGAERFGLSQLHQFRGRVGRGEHKSYCFLFSSSGNENTRLKAMEKTENGFELAEIDMNLRGTGEIFGLRQSGIPDLKMANLMDGRLINDARKYAEEYYTKTLFSELEKRVQKRKKTMGRG